MWHTGQVHVTPGLKLYIMELMHAFGSYHHFKFLKNVRCFGRAFCFCHQKNHSKSTDNIDSFVVCMTTES